MSGPVSFATAEEIADRIRARGLTVSCVGIFAVGEDGHVKLTIKGLPETWEALLVRPAAIDILMDHIIGKPGLKCTACGYFTSGSGNRACRNCGKWHYWTGAFTWPADTEFAKQWLAERRESVNQWLQEQLQAKMAAAAISVAEPAADPPSEAKG